MIAGAFEIPGYLLSWLYEITGNSYVLAIVLLAVIVMTMVTPLILKSTRGMLEMQRLAPEMRQLQNEYKDDRQQLNQEMMKLYQEHKVNPMASCLPLAAQSPIFLILFRLLHGLTWRPTGHQELMAHTILSSTGEPATADVGFFPRYISKASDLYQSLVHETEMSALGLDLSRSAAEMLGDNFTRGLIYAFLVALLGLLYFGQQRMVAARAAVSPTMSETQQKLMQYLPVMFAVFQIFFLLALVIYYIAQTLIRIAQQAYITRVYYRDEESLGRQAQAASERARELAKQNGDGGGLLGRAKADLGQAKQKAEKRAEAAEQKSRNSKRTTAPKGRPTPRNATSRTGRPPSSKKRRKKR